MRRSEVICKEESGKKFVQNSVVDSKFGHIERSHRFITHNVEQTEIDCTKVCPRWIAFPCEESEIIMRKGY